MSLQEVIAYNYDQPTLQRIDKMDQTPADNNQISDIWGFMYEAMDKANYILEFQDKTAFEGKQEVIAQAYFLRAYFAFELTKFFGDIPLLLNEAGTRIQNKRIHTADPLRCEPRREQSQSLRIDRGGPRRSDRARIAYIPNKSQ